MSKYHPSDDGKVVDGATVVWINPPASAASDKPTKPTDADKAASSKAQAAALTSAARDGVPFCEHCEKARRELDRRAGRES